MSLDSRYGKGASKGLRKALKIHGFPKPFVEELVAQSGDIRVNATWDQAIVKMDFFPETVVFVDLSSGSTERTNLYTALCDSLPGYCKSIGIKNFMALAATMDEAKILKKRGHWQGDGAELKWVL